ncbi:xanthine dehydrogenase family protein molybdopterin-binding subunit [Planotetraspora mira]|uniref:Xanthine dehydrogenase n=1 Tax=Planotetraspora mira TaxID=58121 RepID=A0A8J3TUX9_9ACTN|nr:xanthine dehydrogenase family protein molybdopterin-binding subunit [Planotetraspora mira]GII32581.1 xanthine dehydrogenase [Planotetraspora mira]
MSAPTQRVDARLKVTGAARYGADLTSPNLAHAVFAVSTIGKGRVVNVETAAAEAVPGVLMVLTRFDASDLGSPGFLMGHGYGFQSLQPLVDDRIAYRGQPIALVVADTLIAATEAANLIRADYEIEPIAVALDAEGAETLSQQEAIPLPFLADIVVGDAGAAFDASPVRIEATFDLPQQHQVPMELIGGVVGWRGDTLVVHEGTQNAGALRGGLARQLGLDPAKIEIISPYTGGGFGQKNSLQPHVGPLALASRRLGRPIKFVMPRTQTFHQASFRPASRQLVRLGADETGRLLAAVHEVDQQTSRHDLFPALYTEITSRLYGIGQFRGRHRLVRTDVQTPGFMRAPWEQAAAFAFESVVDEIAYALGQDPVALRLANDADVDPVTGQPFSSRHLAECLRRGADMFGWAGRTHEPGSMRGADGTQIGWGVASGAYPASIAPAVARLSAAADGKVTVGVDGHEMGQGIRTAIVRLISEDLSVAAEDVIVYVGDTRVAPQHLTAGSWGTATALQAVHAALRDLRKRLNVADSDPVDVEALVAATGQATVDVEATTVAPGQPPEIIEQSRAGLVSFAGPVYPGFTAFSFIAHFAEVRIEPTTRRIRVPRVVSVVDCGRVASPVTAVSQVRGGVVWGIGGALRERSEVDPRYGGFANATMEEYPIPVNADIGEVEVGFVDEPDLLLNPVGVKGLGEVSMVGVAAAIANAVFHATGRRHRRLPIRIEDVL